MRRKILIVIGIVSFIILSFFIGMIIWSTTFRTGPIARVDTISVNDFYGENITIKVKATDYSSLGDFRTFYYDGTLDDLKKAALAMTDKNAKYETESVGNALLIIKTTDKISYCAIKKLAPDNKFVITNMTATLHADEPIRFLLPHHYYVDISPTDDESLYVRFDVNAKINSSNSYYDWKSFYTKLSRPEYNFNDEEQKITIGEIIIEFISDVEATIYVQ